ncbi:hypothetical protein BaRGS_00002761 [Batillaria attramentaria]|uniref:Uncharacterized protein n=1 Tax=Batillaria attramentaria TaxID=370345 RepID=A0ABD0M2J8_9CAEN
MGVGRTRLSADAVRELRLNSNFAVLQLCFESTTPEQLRNAKSHKNMMMRTITRTCTANSSCALHTLVTALRSAALDKALQQKSSTNITIQHKTDCTVYQYIQNQTKYPK